jgi:WD40 repeat protein
VEAVTITPDGKYVISEGFTLKMWDLSFGSEPRTLSDEFYGRGGVVVTPDNQFVIANYRDISLKMWELASLQEVDTGLRYDFTGFSNRGFENIAISSDGQHLAVCHARELIILNLANKEQPIWLEGNRENLNCVIFTPDNRFVIAGSDFGNLIIWDLLNKKEPFRLIGHTHYVTATAVLPGSQQIISASADKSLKVWDLNTRHELFTLLGHKSHISSVAVTPDGQLAVSGSWDKSLKVWDLEHQKELATFHGHSDGVNAVAMMPNGQQIVSASMDHTLKVWDLTRLSSNNRDFNQPYVSHQDTIHELVITPNGERVVSASEDNTLKIWDVASGHLQHTLRGHTNVVCAVAVTPDGKQIVSASSDETLKIWDVAEGILLRTLAGHHGFVKDVAIIPSSKMAISASNDHTLKIWQLDSGREIMTLAGHPAAVTAVVVTPDGRKAISTTRDSAERSKAVTVWDLQAGKELYPLTGIGLGGRYGSNIGDFGRILVTPDGLHLITVKGSHELMVWDLASEVEVCTISAPQTREFHHIFEAIISTYDSQQIITGSTDGIIRLWNIASGEELRSFAGHLASVTTLALMPEGDRLVSASLDQTLKVWDLDSGELVTHFSGDGGFTACAVAPDGTIIAGESSGKIHFLQMVTDGHYQ